ncbi:MAG: diacylglycerol/lipid kinase family protein [Desulfobaccales bacterium]
MKTVAIVNPVAGCRRAPRHWPFLKDSLGAPGTGVVTWWTEGPGHAENLAARARRQGFERVLAVGGDGTLIEVVNGLWWEPQGLLPSVGMVPFGTGCDYVRNFDLGQSLREKLVTALGKTTMAVSVGLAHLRGMDGQARRRIFLNVLGVGFDAKVIARFRGRRVILPSKTAYFLSALQELRQLTYHRITGEVDGKPLKMKAMLVVAGLGRYFGGGMMITPGASPLSGHFQVALYQKFTRWELLALTPRLYSGRQVDHPRVAMCYARHVKMVADPYAYVEAEGELQGRTPLSLEIIPGALQFAARSSD